MFCQRGMMVLAVLLEPILPLGIGQSAERAAAPSGMHPSPSRCCWAVDTQFAVLRCIFCAPAISALPVAEVSGGIPGIQSGFSRPRTKEFNWASSIFYTRRRTARPSGRLASALLPRSVSFHGEYPSATFTPLYWSRSTAPVPICLFRVYYWVDDSSCIQLGKGAVDK